MSITSALKQNHYSWLSMKHLEENPWKVVDHSTTFFSQISWRFGGSRILIYTYLLFAILMFHSSLNPPRGQWKLLFLTLGGNNRQIPIISIKFVIITISLINSTCSAYSTICWNFYVQHLIVKLQNPCAFQKDMLRYSIAITFLSFSYWKNCICMHCKES